MKRRGDVAKRGSTCCSAPSVDSFEERDFAHGS